MVRRKTKHDFSHISTPLRPATKTKTNVQNLLYLINEKCLRKDAKPSHWKTINYSERHSFVPAKLWCDAAAAVTVSAAGEADVIKLYIPTQHGGQVTSCCGPCGGRHRRNHLKHILSNHTRLPRQSSVRIQRLSTISLLSTSKHRAKKNCTLGRLSFASTGTIH